MPTKDANIRGFITMLPLSTPRVVRCPGVWFAIRAFCALAVTLPGRGAAPAQNAASLPPLLSPTESKLIIRPAYLGDEACVSCHHDKAVTYHQTAHAKTSSPASRDSIRGDFSAGVNKLRTANPNLFFQMEARDGAFFQTGVARNSVGEVFTRSEKFDVVVGSGRKGQTYLYWDAEQLYQLPVSYWTDQDAWVNSPGYVDGLADFERPIGPRCLECHGTSFESRAPPEHKFNKASLVLGISCEKCHGPGGEHVARFRSASPPKFPAETAIVNPAKLARDRQTDLCSLCHAGAGDSLTPPLSFRPGDVLAAHLTFPKQASGTQIDVHASQVQLLERSRCFQSSPAMTCTTCHDVHQPQRDLAAFAAKCLQCHKVEHCGEFPKQGRVIASQCASCHMPLEQTGKIVISGRGAGPMQPKVRNHQIAIYPAVRP